MHETELEKATRVRAREAAKAPSAPASGLVELASAVGNQAFGQAITRETASASLRRVPRVRESASSAMIARNGDEDDPGLDDGQKTRMKAMCVTPIRSAAGKLAAGEKADVRSVIRHLRPVVTALNGFSAKGATRATIRTAADKLTFNITTLDSLALNHKQAIFLARTAWQTSRRQIAATRRLLKASKGASPEEVAELEEGRAHLDALSEQVAATIRDLVEAPRTKEGFQEVGDTAVQLIEQFDSFSVEGGTVPPSFVAARKSMFEGIARIAPLALGKEEVLTEIKDSLTSIANDLARISDGEIEGEPDPEESEDEPPEPEEGAEDEDEEEKDKPEPAPSPNPLPPPPPPPIPVR